MSAIRNCEITGYGSYLPDGPENVVTFGDQTRYRVSDDMDQLDLLGAASLQALDRAELGPNDIDGIIVGSAVGVQPLPSTAALLQERIAPDAKAAAFDVNSSCSSFMTALDTAADAIAAGRYRNVLIASGDVGSRALNPEHIESYELFSDAGAAVVLSRTDDSDKGILASAMRTWPRHAHDTELRGGLTGIMSRHHNDRPKDFLFDMKGPRALLSMARLLPPFFKEFYEESGIRPEDAKLVIPHQASRALGMVMDRIGIAQDRYVDNVQEYGNMVSASVPYMLAKSLGEGALQSGDTVVLCGTAAGLTANIVAMKL